MENIQIDTKVPQRPAEDRRQLFSREYVIDMDAECAAIAAGYSSVSAKAKASQLLKHPRVMAAIDKLQSSRSTKLGVKADRVIEELCRVAFANILDYMQPDENGEMRLDLRHVTRDQAAAISEIREDATGGAGDGERKLIVRTTFKLQDKLKALELLGKHLGMFPREIQQNNLTINISLAENLKTARQRLQLVKPVEMLPEAIDMDKAG